MRVPVCGHLGHGPPASLLAMAGEASPDPTYPADGLGEAFPAPADRLTLQGRAFLRLQETVKQPLIDYFLSQTVKNQS